MGKKEGEKKRIVYRYSIDTPQTILLKQKTKTPQHKVKFQKRYVNDVMIGTRNNNNSNK